MLAPPERDPQVIAHCSALSTTDLCRHYERLYAAEGALAKRVHQVAALLSQRLASERAEYREVDGYRYVPTSYGVRRIALS